MKMKGYQWKLRLWIVFVLVDVISGKCLEESFTITKDGNLLLEITSNGTLYACNGRNLCEETGSYPNNNTINNINNIYNSSNPSPWESIENTIVPSGAEETSILFSGGSALIESTFSGNCTAQLSGFGLSDPSDSAFTFLGCKAATRGGFNHLLADDTQIGEWSTAFGGSDADAESQILADGLGAFVSGVVTTNGTLSSSGQATAVFGLSENNGAIRATTDGAFASGHAQDFGSIIATGFAAGFAKDVDSTVHAQVSGSTAMGYAASAGEITAEAPGAFARGVASSGGNLSATQPGAYAAGNVQTGGIIKADGIGAVAIGHTAHFGYITATATGAFARGSATSSSSVTATQSGAHASGIAESSGTIKADGTGAVAIGHADSGGNITATETGAFAQGSAISASSIIATQRGAHAFGTARYSAKIESDGIGAVAMGHAETAEIIATGAGAFAGGSATSGGTIKATQSGAYASGYVTSAGTIDAEATGAVVLGYATGPSSALTASGIGAMAMGVVQGGQTTSATETGAVAIGSGSTAEAKSALALGFGLKSPFFSCMTVGRCNIDSYAVNLPGDITTPDETISSTSEGNPVFVVGGGTVTDGLTDAQDGECDVRSNALTVTAEGNVFVKKDVYLNVGDDPFDDNAMTAHTRGDGSRNERVSLSEVVRQVQMLEAAEVQRAEREQRRDENGGECGCDGQVEAELRAEIAELKQTTSSEIAALKQAMSDLLLKLRLSE